MGRKRSNADQVKDILNAIAPDDNNNGDKSTKKSTTKRPKRKDKERRQSDQVKDILNNIAPDDESESDEEEQNAKNIAYMKRRSLARRKSKGDELKAMLN